MCLKFITVLLVTAGHAEKGFPAVSAMRGSSKTLRSCRAPESLGGPGMMNPEMKGKS